MQIERTFCPIAVSVSEAAQWTSLGRTKIYELINEGTLKTVKVGRRTLITMSSIHALVDQGA